MGKNCAVIVAAGRGTRMGAKINKQFIHIGDKPVLYHTLRVFSECPLIDEIVLVLSTEDIEYCKNNIINKYSIQKISSIVKGEAERQESVYNGLKALEDCEVVLIHDGARPFVTNRIIEDGINYALVHGASACGVAPKDTIKVRSTEGFSISTPDRASLYSVQTPQCFRYEIIFNCHKRLQEDTIFVTDDTMVVENYGHKVFLYKGEYSNIKITTQEDLAIAESILYSRKHGNDRE
jgi:2-C-methyl-D-erythritol 4-phosphate cytidylyltransferase